MPGDRAVDLLNMIRPKGQAPGLRVVKILTTDPSPITLCFEGTALALDLVIFEVPVGLYPLKVGDRILAYPIAGNGTNRWGLLHKINGGSVTLATMQSASSLQIDGMDHIYSGSSVLAPTGLAAGNRVSVAAVYDSGAIKYAVLTKY